MGSIIKVEHLSYVYNPGMPNAVTALDDVSFEVEEGDFVGIIGATGSGKSTLITHMNGLNKPTSGKIFIDGRDLWAEPEKIRDFRFLTGLVFQYPEYQLFEETCYKDIAFGPGNMGKTGAELDRCVRESAKLVGLGEETGSLEPGKCADLVVTGENPLEDLKALRYMDLVMARGNLYRSPKVKKMEKAERELDKFL